MKGTEMRVCDGPIVMQFTSTNVDTVAKPRVSSRETRRQETPKVHATVLTVVHS